MLASYHSNSAIMLFQSNIISKKVVFDKNSCTTGLPSVTITLETREHPYIHLNMKYVTGPVCHVINEPVLFNHDIWVVSKTKIWALNMNDSSSHSDIFEKGVIDENHRTPISFDNESWYVFNHINCNGIIKFCVGINHILEKIIGCPFHIRAELELKTCPSIVRILCSYLLIRKIIE